MRQTPRAQGDMGHVEGFYAVPGWISLGDRRFRLRPARKAPFPRRWRRPKAASCRGARQKIRETHGPRLHILRSSKRSALVDP